MNESIEIPVIEKPELFIGLVGATGTDLNTVYNNIEKTLEAFNYNTYQIKISKFFYDSYFINKYDIKIDQSDTFQRVYGQMEAGNKIREKSDHSSILAMYTIKEVREIREIHHKKTKNEKGIAYIFQSLKHPEESKLLSEVYGFGYYQIGVYSEKEKRIKYLLEKKNQINESDAEKLIKKDTDEDKPYGQKTRDTFQLSDFFIKQSQDTTENSQKDISRIFDLIFGHPYITPTRDEHMMYMAYTYSTRSADLSRQVGAVICNTSGDIIGLGSNDVPRFGGGPYWPHDKDKEDWRDYRYIQDEWKNDQLLENRGERGEDANQINRDQIIEKIIKVFQHETSNHFAKDEMTTKLLEAGVSDIKEFGRPTHAEMSAILNCARNGISLRGGTIYCTTFPCHNCTRHIIDAGIKKVVFVEPYPSSKAKLLHCDSILVESSKSDKKKVTFEHFIGVAARRYLDLFSLKLGMGSPIKRKDKQGKTINFNRNIAKIRVPLTVSSYLGKETLVHQNTIL